jgi:hypothetical protein
MLENPLKELLSQLAENTKKAPGWLPLLILCYIGFYVLPDGIAIMELSLKSHTELIVAGVTLVLYVFGDAFDKPVFKRLAPKIAKRLNEYRLKARDSLLINDGIYRVSKSLAIAAEAYERSWIRVKNESSKLFRSLVVPSIGAGIVLLLLQSHVWLGIAAVAAGVIFLFMYVWLKASHILDLYELSEKLVSKDDYEAYNLTEKARLFFWKGELVASATPR